MLRRVLWILGLHRSPGVGSSAALGRAGERHAVKYLRRAGYRILDRNVTLPMGEADIVAEAPPEPSAGGARAIVVVEVKCRVLGDSAHPPPEAQVHPAKRRKLLAILRYLSKANHWEGRPRRVDIIAIDWGPRGARTLRHFVGAVRG